MTKANDDARQIIAPRIALDISAEPIPNTSSVEKPEKPLMEQRVKVR